MFNVGGPEILVILLIALIVLGPQRLPSAARQVGKAMAEFRRMTTGFQAEVRDALNETLIAPAAPAPTPEAVADASFEASPPSPDPGAPDPVEGTVTAAAPMPQGTEADWLGTATAEVNVDAEAAAAPAADNEAALRAPDADRDDEGPAV